MQIWIVINVICMLEYIKTKFRNNDTLYMILIISSFEIRN
jgi:hypothetical protein